MKGVEDLKDAIMPVQWKRIRPKLMTVGVDPGGPYSYHVQPWYRRGYYEEDSCTDGPAALSRQNP